MADIHINVEDGLKKKIKISCAEMEETITEYILRLIREDIKKNESK